VGNLVVDNDDPTAPAIPNGYFGGGIGVGGGTRNTILRNRVSGHDRAGIELLARDGFSPLDNRIEGNVLTDNTIDLLYASNDAGGNCFAGNQFVRSLPERIEQVLPCGAPASVFAEPSFTPPRAPSFVDYRTLPPPPPQPTMPDSARRAVAGAGPRPEIDLAAIAVPS
jgi:parallel beta-helix repeat protein